jgi:glutaredoxin
MRNIMKWLIRIFFRTVRRIVGPIMLLIDKMTSPKGIKRPAAEQEQLDQLTRNMALYQFRTCPFCIKVRREIKRQSLNIELRDAQHAQQHRQDLLNGGGQIKVPCLRVVNKESDDTWLYESNVIIAYLRQLVA